MSESIEFTVPLPPVSLRANSRAHWSKKKRDADAYSEAVWRAAFYQDCSPVRLAIRADRQEVPWAAAHVVYTWHYCGVAPDHGNLGANTKYLQDILCMAPKSKAGKDRYYLGIVENDSGLTCEYHMEKVAKRTLENVHIKITRVVE